MAQLQSNLSNSSSSRYGEGVNGGAGSASARPADVLASCYVIDDAATQLKGLHYCTTGATGAECPPLAAISANNELTVFPKRKTEPSSARPNIRRGGATLRIREECERLFCETMKTVFLGERNMASNGSSLAGVRPYVSTDYNNYEDHDITPEGHAGGRFSHRRTSSVSVADSSRSYSFGSSVGAHSLGAASFSTAASSVDVDDMMAYAVPSAWLELWDFVGCGSFRGFLAEDPAGETSLFAFFDASVLSRDLKRALMALIELADTALNCAHLVICVDRGSRGATESDLPEDAATLLKGLQWAGFSLTTLDTWTGGSCVDVTSSRWIFMGMEL